ncbi:MAG: DUF2298 domain-containing protein [Anaerolineales bacterium]|nr:DUF2298 domain-containing protein [Anaerolineales bacterium]
MSHWAIWYLVVTGLSWLAFPISYRLLPALKDRGYAVSRALGLLLWGFLFWLLASLGILRNEPTGLLFAAALMGGLTLWALLGVHPQEMFAWLRAQWRMILVVEVLFLLAFALWALVRAANPEAVGTEKPMELAFINAILKSPTFPPHDPWLSGYAISYYYFGYVLVAMLAMISGTPGAIAFNLGVSLVFALSAIGAYGLLYNLLNASAPVARQTNEGDLAPQRHILSPLLAPFFLLIVSNLEGFLHSLHTRGLFWTADETGALSSAFWKWLDIKDLNQPPALPLSWQPTRFWWWWRASRVLQDYDLANNAREIIDEFPFFSYLLGDLHPHVLAMPFAMLAMTIAQNFLLGGSRNPQPWPRLRLSRGSEFASLRLSPAAALLAAVALGGMAFLNIWDFPLFLTLAASAYALSFVLQGEKSILQATADFLWFGLFVGLAGALLYLPFYLSFSSQAGGVLPNLIYPTRGAHLWVMFGTLLLPILAYLAYFSRSLTDRQWLARGLGLAGGFMLLLWLLSLTLGALILLIPEARAPFLGSLAAQDSAQLFSNALIRRFLSPGGWITLLVLLAFCLGLLTAFDRRNSSAQEASPPFRARTFAVLLILMGTLLVVGPEFFYLRDLFGWRMNTIFKFYFTAWQVWSIAASYGAVILVMELRGSPRAVFSLGLTALLAAGLVYPVFGLWSKTNGFAPGQWTLDSSAYLARQSPDEMKAIQFLQAAPPGVLAEAVDYQGGDYREYGRMATFSGHPAVLGWIGHQNQWRGENSGKAMGSRQDDIERLYCTRNWQEARLILDQYSIRYVVVGTLERATYNANDDACPNGLVETKFIRNLPPVFSSGTVVIYEYTGLNDE